MRKRSVNNEIKWKEWKQMANQKPKMDAIGATAFVAGAMTEGFFKMLLSKKKPVGCRNRRARRRRR